MPWPTTKFKGEDARVREQQVSLLLTDGSDAELPTDLLEHAAIARALAGVIRGTNKEAASVSAYGAWGQGKAAQSDDSLRCRAQTGD